MKKSYMIPTMLVVATQTTQMIAASNPEGFNQTLNPNGGNGSNALVKERNDYNVWDDDWSR